MTRHIDFEAIENFRDFGGYDTACGRGVKRGLLYRSANHARATDADLEALRAMGVAAIIDLRRPVERTREPSRRWADFAARVIENDLESHHQDWAEVLRSADPDAAWFRNDGLGFYAQALFEPRHVDLFSRYFRALAEVEGPIVVHCAAGKDRTGMICALTHHLAGVSQDDILEDYLLTNDPARIARRAESFSVWFEETLGRPIDPEAARVALSVFPEYLDCAFQAAVDAHGSLDGYLADVLGVDAALRERLHAKLLG